MTDPVAPNELLARFITTSKWFRKQDQTVKPDAFIPPDPPVELSVTRHLNLAKDHIWMIGKKIVVGMSRTLHGRADVEAAHVIAQQLAIVPQPEQDNPNHANIVGWSSDKDVRKIRAMEIARVARFIPNPEITT